MAACMLFYDIPENRGIRNPSRTLYPIAVRIQLSCWVIDERNLPLVYLNSLRERGATWHTVRFDTSESKKVNALVLDALRRQIREAVANARRSSRRASRALGTIDDEQTTQERIERFDAATRRIIRNCATRLRDFGRVSKLFGISERALSFPEMIAQVEGLQFAMHERAKEYSRLADQLEAVGGGIAGLDSTIVARMMRRNEIPDYVATDFADDMGLDAGPYRRTF